MLIGIRECGETAGEGTSGDGRFGQGSLRRLGARWPPHDRSAAAGNDGGSAGAAYLRRRADRRSNPKLEARDLFGIRGHFGVASPNPRIPILDLAKSAFHIGLCLTAHGSSVTFRESEPRGKVKEI